MKLFKFYKKAIFAFLFLVLILFIGLMFYINRISVYGDLSIDIVNVSSDSINAEIITNSPLNRDVLLTENEDGSWKTHDIYIRKIFIRLNPENIHTQELILRINNIEIPIKIDKIQVDSDKLALVEVPYKTNSSVFRKIHYVFSINIKHLISKSSLKILLYTLLFMELFIMSLYFILKGEKRNLISERIYVLLSNSKIKRRLNNNRMEVLLFSLLWLTILLITLCVVN